MNNNKKWYESKKYLCYLLTAIILTAISAFMVWKELGWQAVAVTGMLTLISAVLIIGQASVDRILYRGAQIAAAVKSGEQPEDEEG